METASLTAAVIGAVELVNRLFDRDFRSASKIVVAGLVGALLAPFVGVAWLAGLVLGLGAAGVITTATRIGSRVA